MKIKWVVNDMAELGVKINGKCYFLYKGDSIVYEDGKHEDGTDILHRLVGKREFGECCHPLNYRGEFPYLTPCVWHPVLSFGPENDPDYQWLPVIASKNNNEVKK